MDCKAALCPLLELVSIVPIYDGVDVVSSFTVVGRVLQKPGVSCDKSDYVSWVIVSIQPILQFISALVIRVYRAIRQLYYIYLSVLEIFSGSQVNKSGTVMLGKCYGS